MKIKTLMFTYKFTASNNKTPQFELDGVALRMTAVPGFLCLEYCGTSYKGQDCLLEIRVNSREYKFVYSFCMFNPWFELPVEAREAGFGVSIGLRRETKESQLVGLKNLGATCYINSLVQTVYYLDVFKRYVYGSRGYHMLLLQRLFYRLDAANRRRIASACMGADAAVAADGGGAATDDSVDVYDAMSSFIRNLSFVDSVNTHQDVHEFSKILFDKLEIENKELKNVMEGSIVNIIECDCTCTSIKDDPFQDIQMALKDGKTSIRSLGDSLRLFCREEELKGYRCERHGPTKARRRIMFKRLPEVLFVLINRFSIDWEKDEFIKNNDYYSFPERIDLREYVHDCGDENNETHGYGLFSTIVHSGVADEGHFYCYINLNNKYYKFNDNDVYECSREEALDWNFGGKYAHNNRKKTFSAYYLVYLRDGGEPRVPSFDMLSAMAPDSTLICDIASTRKPVFYSYLANTHITGYTGPGRFNVSDYSYPLVKPSESNCFEFDNVSRMFGSRLVFDSDFRPVSDAPVSPDQVYFLSDRKAKGKLIFVKLFREVPWCTYPLNLYSLGAFFLSSLDDFKPFTDSPSFLLFKELGDSVVPVDDFSVLETGDAVIISRGCIKQFMRDYMRHELINISVNNCAVSSIFVEKNLGILEMERSIQEFVSSDEIFVVKSSDVSGDRSSFVGDRNTVECLVNSGVLLYVGIQSGLDINLIDHVHLFLLPCGSNKNDLLKQFKFSKFVCMAALQSEPELQVVESFKESPNIRILDENDELAPNNGFIIIQKKMVNPIRVSFYRDMYKLINYPFLIENPGSIAAFRERFFFTNKIVRFDGYHYYECNHNDPLDLKGHEMLLIEQK